MNPVREINEAFHPVGTCQTLVYIENDIAAIVGFEFAYDCKHNWIRQRKSAEEKIPGDLKCGLHDKKRGDAEAPPYSFIFVIDLEFDWPFSRFHYPLLSKSEACGRISDGFFSLLCLRLYVKYTTSPIAIQRKAALSVNVSMATIMPVQISAPNMGTMGTSGVLKGLSIFGLFTRKIQMPILTSTNASNVPKLVRSPATCPGTKAANNPTKTKRIQFDL